MSENTKEEDFLTWDAPLPGQNYVCLSFLSPERVLNDKNLYFLLNFIKNKFNYEKNLKDLKNEYDDYMFSNQKKLDDEFHEQNEFQTTVRGVKIRGVFNTEMEAKVRAKSLRRVDPSHNIYLGQVGFWLPWDPNPNDIEDQE